MNQETCLSPHPALSYFLELYKNKPEIQALSKKLKKIRRTDKLISFYALALPLIEKNLWQSTPPNTDIKYYQNFFHELESLVCIEYSVEKSDLRYQFIIAIPVADRPEHLNSCLQSILYLCKAYNYGGFSQGKYNKIRVLIADDSKHRKNIDANIKMASLYSEKGLETIYFGQEEQKNILASNKAKDTKNIFFNSKTDTFYHKGASTTRNITYLKLRELTHNNNKTLFYFIDSDQKFKIRITSEGEDRELYSINYFYYLNQIFSSTNTTILTGKVVGDPPVSPSVMAANLLNDIIFFITEISKTNSQQNCQFHQRKGGGIDDASYHDMADLFGFKPPAHSHQYNCNIRGKHNNAQCLTGFSEKLSLFFDGVHPTRKSYYEYKSIPQSISPARTIYTGNYIFNHRGLKYFIPFADLKLRMAGPTLGRIIKAEIGEQFVSANLPMLHTRTISSSGQSEFRAGVNHNNTGRKKHENSVDLSCEFERQFFGDIMLFSIEKLTALGYPKISIPQDIISNTVNDTINSMLEKYNHKQNEIKSKITILEKLLNKHKHWGNQTPDMEATKHSFMNFIHNIEHNFGDKATAYHFINSDKNMQCYRQKILAAISDYTQDLENWNKALSET